MGFEYRIAKIPKKDGSHRILEIPNDELKKKQTEILHNVIYKFSAHFSSHGFVKNKNCISNAKAHKNAYVIIKLDIREFFFRAKIQYFKPMLENMVKHHQIKLTKAEIEEILELTSRFGHLPTGSPTSPAIGNLILKAIDYNLYTWCISKNLRYTRYADDITISSKKRLSKKEIKEIIEHVRLFLRNKRGLVLNKNKIRVFSRKHRMEVTGIVVNKPHTLTISKKYRNNIRAAIHQAKTPKDIERIKGRIAWVQQVQPKAAKNLSLLLSKKLQTLQLTP